MTELLRSRVVCPKRSLLIVTLQGGAEPGHSRGCPRDDSGPNGVLPDNCRATVRAGAGQSSRSASKSDQTGKRTPNARLESGRSRHDTDRAAGSGDDHGEVTRARTAPATVRAWVWFSGCHCGYPNPIRDWKWRGDRRACRSSSVLAAGRQRAFFAIRDSTGFNSAVTAGVFSTSAPLRAMSTTALPSGRESAATRNGSFRAACA